MDIIDYIFIYNCTRYFIYIAPINILETRKNNINGLSIFLFNKIELFMKVEFEKMISNNKFLILRICPFYYAWNNKEAIEDLYQEIVLNLWKSYPKFIKNQQCKPSTWLYRVALNTALLQKRNERKIIYTLLNNSLCAPNFGLFIIIALPFVVIPLITIQEGTVVVYGVVVGILYVVLLLCFSKSLWQKKRKIISEIKKIELSK